MVARHCRGCGVLLAATSRPDRRFCSPVCRLREHRRRHGPVVTPVELDRLVGRVDAALAETALVNGIARAAAADWRAAAWVLARRYPERWGLPDERGEPVEDAL